MNLYSI